MRRKAFLRIVGLALFAVVLSDAEAPEETAPTDTNESVEPDLAGGRSSSRAYPAHLERAALESLLPADPGRMPAPESTWANGLFSRDGAGLGKALSEAGIVPNVDVVAKEVPLGTRCVEAITVSGMLWINDQLDNVSVHERWGLYGYTMADATARLEAVGLTDADVQLTGIGVGVKLRALTPAGRRWVRLCRYFNARMSEPWDGEERPGPMTRFRRAERQPCAGAIVVAFPRGGPASMSAWIKGPGYNCEVTWSDLSDPLKWTPVGETEAASTPSPGRYRRCQGRPGAGELVVAHALALEPLCAWLTGPGIYRMITWAELNDPLEWTREVDDQSPKETP